jgi:hypothetical protein
MLQHPEITNIERTGYPSWIKVKDLDVEEEEVVTDEEDDWE